MDRTQFILRAGVWLAFLVTALGLPLVYLSDAPTPIGTGLLRVFGWGALVGFSLSVAVYVLYRPLSDHRNFAGKLKALAGVISMGIFGGAAGAALLDQSRTIGTRAVELPIVKIEELPARRRAAALQIATLAPLDPTYEDHLSASDVRGKWVRQGDCLVGVVERGWLGGAWVRRYTAQPCSKGRGVSSSSHVLIVNADFASWRWYSPRSYQRTGKGQALDEGLPPNLTCRIRQGSWLYRCMGRDPSRQPERNSPEQGTWSTDRKSCPTDPWTIVGTDPLHLTKATESCSAQMTSIGIDGALNLRAVCKDRRGEHVELWSVRLQGQLLDFRRIRSEAWDESPVARHMLQRCGS